MSHTLQAQQRDFALHAQTTPIEAAMDSPTLQEQVREHHKKVGMAMRGISPSFTKLCSISGSADEPDVSKGSSRRVNTVTVPAIAAWSFWNGGHVH